MHSKTPAQHRAKSSDERLHSDISDENESLSEIGGYRYEAIVMNDYSRMKFSLIFKAKDDIVSQIKILFNKMKTHTERKIKFFRTDDRREFLSLSGVLNEKDIEGEKFVSFAQDQDEISERAIRTIIEKARILMISANLSKKFGSKALSAACHLSNRSLIKTLHEKIPYETGYEEKSDLSNLRMYDCDAYVIDYHAKNKSKIIKRAGSEILINYEIKNQGRIFDETSVFIRKNVVFNESKIIYKKSDNSSELVRMLDIDDLFQSLNDNLQETLQKPLNVQSVRIDDQKRIFSEEKISNQINISSSAESHQSVRVNASNENAHQVTLLADDDDNDENFVLVGQSDDEMMIDFAHEMNDQNDENEPHDELISKKNNSLILNYSRSKIRHDYKQLHEKGLSIKDAKSQKKFIKSAKIASQHTRHDLKTSKTFEQAINDPQAKE